MECRENCAACCIYLSISSPIPGMPAGKKAGERCIHLTDNLACAIYDQPTKPQVCTNFKPEILFCGNSAQEAYKILAELAGIKLKDYK